MAALRLKLRLSSVEDHKNSEGHKHGESLVFFAVVGDTPENKEWSDATPSAQLNMYITNPKAFHKMKQGDEYYCDLIPAHEG